MQSPDTTNKNIISNISSASSDKNTDSLQSNSTSSVGSSSDCLSGFGAIFVAYLRAAVEANPSTTVSTGAITFSPCAALAQQVQTAVTEQGTDVAGSFAACFALAGTGCASASQLDSRLFRLSICVALLRTSVSATACAIDSVLDEDAGTSMRRKTKRHRSRQLNTNANVTHTADGSNSIADSDSDDPDIAGSSFGAQRNRVVIAFLLSYKNASAAAEAVAGDLRNIADNGAEKFRLRLIDALATIYPEVPAYTVTGIELLGDLAVTSTVGRSGDGAVSVSAEAVHEDSGDGSTIRYAGVGEIGGGRGGGDGGVMNPG